MRNGAAAPKPEAVIFDMDGVLVDSEPFGFEALRRVMARYGLPYGEAENAEFLGRTTLDSCRILRERHRLPESAEMLAESLSLRLDELTVDEGLNAWQAWNAGREAARDALEAARASGQIP